jgi:hypothetical protein
VTGGVRGSLGATKDQLIRLAFANFTRMPKGEDATILFEREVLVEAGAFQGRDCRRRRYAARARERIRRLHEQSVGGSGRVQFHEDCRGRPRPRRVDLPVLWRPRSRRPVEWTVTRFPHGNRKMQGDGTDWAEAASWEGDHPVVDAYGRMRMAVVRGRMAGVSALSDEPTDAQVRVLTASLRNLGSDERTATVLEASRKILYSLAEPGAAAAHPWRDYARILGLEIGAFEAERAEAEGRHFLLAQALAMSPRRWADPVQGILFTVVQYGLELALRRRLRRPEPLKTEALLHFVQGAMEHKIIGAMDKAGAHLPEERSLDFGTASMQAHRDLLAADLAVVAGIRVHGKPMYRVVLFQAKRASRQGWADLSEGQGRQLDVLLSSGMGWYLFYPDEGGGFPAVVRPACELFAEVWSGRDGPALRRACTYGPEAHEAWDLATLVSVAMASTTDTTLGRLFPDARLAAAALSSEGHPLAGEVIAFDATGSLALRDFFDAATTLGYEGRPVVGLPSSRYADVPDREEPSYPGPFEKRW